ncbi:MAG: general secretion pathway protein GspK [Deltaproteobacteria bacterium]|nr:general secretion pathway protein GspK [Deltaproteobacteria bacterium]
MRGARARNRRSRGGIALIVVTAALMILTTLVVDIDFGTRVRFIAATHNRDSTQAYWIANSGMSLMRLVLMGNKQLNDYVKSNSTLKTYFAESGLPTNDLLLTYLPFINTGLLRMMFVGGGDLDEDEVTEYAQTGELSEETVQESRQGGSSKFKNRNFLDFEGDFSAEANGEDCKINISGLANHEDPITEDPIYEMLEALMSGEENEMWLRERNLRPEELVGNLADWVDSDSTVASGAGSYEDNYYNRLDSPYMAKNAPFDSMDEIRLVEGWQDAVFERWGDKITIYGSKKINIACTDQEVIKMMLRAWGGISTDAEAEYVLQGLEQWKADGNVISTCNDFKNAVQEKAGITMDEDFSTYCTSKNTVYTVKSTGSVGDVMVTITAVIDQSSSDAGRVKYWRVE